MSEAQPFVSVRNLKKWFPVERGLIGTGAPRASIRAVDGVSFDIQQGEVLGLVGESGSGKSTVGRLILRLIEATEGDVLIGGQELGPMGDDELRRMRSKMQIVFQDPLASLNPRMTLGTAIEHPVRIHSPSLSADQRRALVLEILERVGLAPGPLYFAKYPHQLSGGQRQRAVIARALVTSPELIVADEPLAMADVSVRSLLLDLLADLKRSLGLTYLFITHDLATAKYICDRVAIMYLGRIVEIGSLADVYREPQHPYTRALLSAVPVPDPRFRRGDPLPVGEIPDARTPPPGCRFHPRCPIAVEGLCDAADPQLLPIAEHASHDVACHLAQTSATQQRP